MASLPELPELIVRRVNGLDLRAATELIGQLHRAAAHPVDIDQLRPEEKQRVGQGY
jgi:hypothetical protein